MTYKDDAKTSQAAKLSRLTGNKSDQDAAVEASEGVKTITSKSDVAPTVGSDGGAKSKARSDRPARARGGVVARASGGLVGPNGPKFHVYDRQTDKVVGGAATASRARLTRDKKDNEYGAYRYSVRPNPSHPDNVDQPKTPEFARGGAVKKSKGKTVVNVIVAPQGGAQQPGASAVPPGGSPAVNLGAGPPPTMPTRPPMPPAGGPPMGAPPPGMPMRKRGGAAKLTAGAGGGLGRLEKASAY